MCVIVSVLKLCILSVVAVQLSSLLQIPATLKKGKSGNFGSQSPSSGRKHSFPSKHAALIVCHCVPSQLEFCLFE